MGTNGQSQFEREEKSKDFMHKLVSDVSDRGKILLNEGWGNAKVLFEENADALKQKANEWSEKSVEEMTDDVKIYVRKNPLKSMALAFGAGYLLGSLFGSD